VSAGRAVQCGSFNGYACALGSNQNMGLDNVFYTNWLYSTKPGTWQIGQCP